MPGRKRPIPCASWPQRCTGQGSPDARPHGFSTAGPRNRTGRQDEPAARADAAPKAQAVVAFYARHRQTKPRFSGRKAGRLPHRRRHDPGRALDAPDEFRPRPGHRGGLPATGTADQRRTGRGGHRHEDRCRAPAEHTDCRATNRPRVRVAGAERASRLGRAGCRSGATRAPATSAQRTVRPEPCCGNRTTRQRYGVPSGTGRRMTATARRIRRPLPPGRGPNRSGRTRNRPWRHGFDVSCRTWIQRFSLDAMAAEGWTVTEAAAKLGCTRQTFSRVLNGRTCISPAMALALERIGFVCGRFGVGERLRLPKRRRSRVELRSPVVTVGRSHCSVVACPQCVTVRLRPQAAPVRRSRLHRPRFITDCVPSGRGRARRPRRRVRCRPARRNARPISTRGSRPSFPRRGRPESASRRKAPRRAARSSRPA